MSKTYCIITHIVYQKGPMNFYIIYNEYDVVLFHDFHLLTNKINTTTSCLNIITQDITFL